MNWINGFELLCYGITVMLLADVTIHKRWFEWRLFCSAALAGFILELLAVRVTGIYHYSPDFFIDLGFEPYQFPFFGGLMWGGLTVCGLRLTRKLDFSKLVTALCTGWLIVSMDMLLDVAAIRLEGGFWVWEGRPITLDVNHHMFMSVIWVNFLGYLFETPAVVYFFLKAEEKAFRRSKGNLIFQTILIGLGGVAVVGAASGLSLFLNGMTDEWFACVAFLLLWILILAGMIVQVVRKKLSLGFSIKHNWTTLVFWGAIYGYCLVALWKLGIIQTLPVYSVFAVCVTIFTLLLSCKSNKEPLPTR